MLKETQLQMGVKETKKALQEKENKKCMSRRMQQQQRCGVQSYKPSR